MNFYDKSQEEMASILEHIDMPNLLKLYATSRNIPWRFSCATNPKIDVASLMLLARDEDDAVRRRACLNKKLRANRLLDLYERGKKDIPTLAGIAENINCPYELQFILVSNEFFVVRESLALNKNCDIFILNRLKSDALNLVSLAAEDALKKKIASINA